MSNLGRSAFFRWTTHRHRRVSTLKQFKWSQCAVITAHQLRHNYFINNYYFHYSIFLFVCLLVVLLCCSKEIYECHFAHRMHRLCHMKPAYMKMATCGFHACDIHSCGDASVGNLRQEVLLAYSSSFFRSSFFIVEVIFV